MRWQLFAVICAAILTLAVMLCGCSYLLKKTSATIESNQSRVPVAREDLPELSEGLPQLTYTPADDASTMATKLEVAELAAKLERLKVDTASAIYAESQKAKQEAEAARTKSDIDLAALEQRLADKNATTKDAEYQNAYASREWLGAIIAGACACILYAYKRVNPLAAIIGLACFGCLFCLVLAGQHYGKYLPFVPVVLIPFALYLVYRAGLLKQALVACVRGVEFANDKGTKQAIKEQPESNKIEIVRKDIDAATVTANKRR